MLLISAKAFIIWIVEDVGDLSSVLAYHATVDILGNDRVLALSRRVVVVLGHGSVRSHVLTRVFRVHVQQISCSDGVSAVLALVEAVGWEPSTLVG